MIKNRRVFTRIARDSAPFFVLINAALVVSALAFCDTVQFDALLCVVAPILCGIVCCLAEKTLRMQTRNG
ncbi:MAG: hypothetical protein IJH48_00370 [Oscillospiraceae bacterium]|nr:hypothetical protein [Oscillospiraceae bacterium]